MILLLLSPGLTVAPCITLGHKSALCATCHLCRARMRFHGRLVRLLESLLKGEKLTCIQRGVLRYTSMGKRAGSGGAINSGQARPQLPAPCSEPCLSSSSHRMTPSRRLEPDRPALRCGPGQPLSKPRRD
ncbi:hypothetical protein FKP32DRAFT_1108862 [Trametes sanguinea]|nr:hypothetical protein FKP32DRAFT_1108862 [Trametes sanguinea]